MASPRKQLVSQNDNAEPAISKNKARVAWMKWLVQDEVKELTKDQIM